MGQKVHPNGLRVGITKDHITHWFAPKSKFGPELVQDYKIRKFVKKELSNAFVSKVLIERRGSKGTDKVKVIVKTARPGMVIGRGGQGREVLRKKLVDEFKTNIDVDVEDIPMPDLDAQLIAENVAAQIERRVTFRRAMKQAIFRSRRSGAKGIKIMVGGRLGGAEVARSEWLREGRVPLQTLRADIDYGFAEAHTIYGLIGVKVWLYVNDFAEHAKFAASILPSPATAKQANLPLEEGEISHVDA
ncbi:30S ribosomal protein S3 [Thermodesulfobium sp. 4217-1]|uniref:30S ribosomal protein S3 n=1 Tax=Thermodesulfobium sp. 4217-1 TaxID=3120013 RepID=UPI003221E1E5